MPVTRRVLQRPEQLFQRISGLQLESVRMAVAQRVAERFPFRVPDYYVCEVLNGDLSDPLLELVLPDPAELVDSDELWDSTESPYRTSRSPFWIQKYEFQGLIRVTSYCSGLCRFCYLKRRKSLSPTVMLPADVDALFDDLDSDAGVPLTEIILSGGDPLVAPIDTLVAIAERVQRLRKRYRRPTPFITIHTREPVWNPIHLVENTQLWHALSLLQPKTFIMHVLHPREVTSQFATACHWLASTCEPIARPILLCQHPVFRGVNDSVKILEQLYIRLLALRDPVIPYYMIHPFHNGTLPRHRLSIQETQSLYRELVRRPGVLVPRLVVPTPKGKSIIGPNETIDTFGDQSMLTTKDGVSVIS